MLLKHWHNVLAVAPTLCLGVSAGNDCCSSLAAQYPGHVFLPGNATYVDEAITSFWSNTSRISPRCVFTPDSADLVSHAVQLFQAEKCRFAIRGGGHCPNKGWSSIHDGVLVAMTKLNELQLHDGYVSIGSGLRWGPVADFLQPHGLAVVGGRTSGVGVAGLTLGGGMSHFTGKRGLACDNVKGFQIVVPGGQILEVDRQSHADLFWALKGTNNRFGVVTRLDLYTYDVPSVYAGTPRLEMEHFDLWARAVDNFVRVASAGPKGPDVAISPKIQYVPALGKPFLLVPMTSTIIPRNSTCGNKTRAQVPLPAPLQGFANLPYTDKLEMQVQTLPELYTETAIPSGLRYELRTLSFKSSVEMITGIKEIVEEEYGPLLNGTGGFSSVLEFQTVTKEAILQGISRGSNALGISVDDAPMIWLALANSWLNATEDDVVQAAGDRLVRRGQALARQLGLSVPFLFANDAAADQDAISTYSQASIKRLHEVAAKYDPGNTFTDLLSGGFQIPKVSS